MKKPLLKLIAALGIGFVALQSPAQVTYLNFPYLSNTNDHEFGYSSAEFKNHSVIGTEFNQSIIVFKGGQYLFRGQGPLNSNFGHSVGLNDSWIAAGARAYDASPSDGNPGSEEGAIFLSKSVNGVYQNNFSTVLTASIPQSGDRYGESIDLAGEWLVVGANQYYSGKGYIEIWKQTTTGWSRKQRIAPGDLPEGAKFGNSVAIYGDHIVVGAPGANRIFLYKNNNGIWQPASIFSPNISTWGKNVGSYYESAFGWDVDITNGYVIVGDPKAEKAGIFTINNSYLALHKTLLPPGYPNGIGYYGEFGHSVAIQLNRVLVGAPISAYPTNDYSGYVRGNIFFYTDGYNYKGRLNPGNPSGIIIRGLGRSVAIDQDNVLSGAEYSDNQNIGIGSYGAAFRSPYWVSIQPNSQRAGEIENGQHSAILFPNITSESETNFSSLQGPIVSVVASTAEGKVKVLSFEGNKIDVNSLEPGLYTLTIQTEENTFNEKFIKK